MVPKNFCGLPKEFTDYKSSRVAVVPVPYDGTSTWGKGADKGPKAMIEASMNMELYDIDTDSEAYRKGIFTDKPVTEASTPEKMVEAVEERIGQHVKAGKFVVMLGGEHSITPPSVRAHARSFKNLSVLQIDAHSDLRKEYEGSKNSHACAMARTKETCPIVQVGIRSMDISEKTNMDASRVFFAKDIHGRRDWFDKVVTKLSENVYITIDLDGFDHSIMPSTGTPEPGGLDWYEVTGLLKRVIGARNVVGFDVVELAPNKLDRAPDFLAAKLVYIILSQKFAKKKDERQGL